MSSCQRCPTSSRSVTTCDFIQAPVGRSMEQTAPSESPKGITGHALSYSGGGGGKLVNIASLGGPSTSMLRGWQSVGS